MAINESQAVQIENEALALKERSDRITNQINDYVATVNADPSPDSQYLSDGKALEAEAVDTLSAVNSFYNSQTVLDGRSDLDYQQRINESIDIIRDARNQTSVAIEDVRSTLATVGTREPLPEDGINSAGLIVDGDANNRTELSATQNPPLDGPESELAIGTPSNADETQTLGTVENTVADITGSRIRPGTTVNNESEAFQEDSGQAPTEPTSTSGVDGISINQGYNKEIEPRENPLSRFGSYTYNVTIYMLRPEEFNRLMSYSEDANSDSPLQIKSVEGFNAILSSGGMPASYDPYSFGGAIRNPNFDLDYFIDDIEIDSLMPQQVRGASNVTSINFRVTEPYGFTFLTRLKKASEELIGGMAGQDWLRQHYLMVIRFYGQDDGTTSQSVFNEVSSDATGATVRVTAQRPIVEKYIPFKFRNITTKAATGAVEYVCDAVPVNHLEAMSQKRASVKYQVEVNGQTLNDIFNGTLAENITQSGDRQVKSGLVESINKYYKKLATVYTDPLTGASRNPVIGIADQYEVKFRGGIGEQKVKAPGSTKKNRTGMADPTFPTLLDSSRNNVQKNRLTFSINAGTQIQQFIDLAVRSSEWVTKQQKKFIDPNTRVVKRKNSNSLLQWYRITSNVEVIGYDELRKDYAYKIIYNVIPSAVSDVKSSFFPQKPFNGCQKRYRYWFTGENTEIINYEVDFNALYYVPSSPDTEPDYSGVGTIGEVTSPGPADQSVLGGSDLSSDPAARAASVLYSPTDYATMNLNILGDPFYIQQGDIFWRSLGVQDNTPGYLPDGSADFDSGEVLIEIDYQTIEDYDENTGVATPRPIELKSAEDIQNTTTLSGVAYKGLIYQITQVTNKLSKGMFTQNLSGVQRYTSPPSNPATARREPEVTPTASLIGSPTTSTSGPVIPPILVTQGIADGDDTED